MKNFQYYYTEEAEQFSFYRIPKQLFTDREYADLSAESKVLYGLLLDRMGLSIKNRWYDKQKRVYIYFTLEEAAQLLGCGRDKAMRLFKELDGRLIHRRKQGCGKPSRIYVGNFAGKNSNQMEEWRELDNTEGCVQQVAKADFKESEMSTSRGREDRLQEVGKYDPNNTDRNNTEINDTDKNLSIHLSWGEGKTQRQLREQFWEQLEYDCLIERYPEDEERLKEFLNLMIGVFAIRSDVIRIGKNQYPAQLVKERMLELRAEHIEYILESLQKTTSPVKNVRQYLLACLFHAPTTYSSYYNMQYQFHEFNRGTEAVNG